MLHVFVHNVLYVRIHALKYMCTADVPHVCAHRVCNVFPALVTFGRTVCINGACGRAIFQWF